MSLLSDLCHMLARQIQNARFHGITISVKGNEIHLEGIVGSFYDKQRLQESIKPLLANQSVILCNNVNVAY